MKKLNKFMTLFALAGLTTFLVGCGDDDGGDDGGQVVITAPQNEGQLRAQQYTLNVAGDPNAQILVFPDQNRYQITSGAETIAGNYSNPSFSGNQVTVTLTPDNQTAENPAGVLTMTFSPAGGSGTFAFTPADGSQQDQGTFTYVPINDPDPDPDPNPQFAPATQAQLEAQTISGTAASGPITISFPGAGAYSVETTAGTETGTFTGSRDGETWTLDMLPGGGGAASSAVLTWNEVNTGTFIYTPGGQAAESGTFTASGGPDPDPDPDPDPTGPAPDNVIGSWNLNVPVGLFTGEFVVTYDATTFSTVRASDGQPMGSGTYTYTKTSGSQANLVHVYGGEFVGDRDEYNLTFSSSTAATFTGSQISGGEATPASGTFSKQ